MPDPILKQVYVFTDNIFVVDDCWLQLASAILPGSEVCFFKKKKSC